MARQAGITVYEEADQTTIDSDSTYLHLKATHGNTPNRADGQSPEIRATSSSSGL